MSGGGTVAVCTSSSETSSTTARENGTGFVIVLERAASIKVIRTYTAHERLECLRAWVRACNSCQRRASRTSLGTKATRLRWPTPSGDVVHDRSTDDCSSDISTRTLCGARFVKEIIPEKRKLASATFSGCLPLYLDSQTTSQLIASLFTVIGAGRRMRVA